MRNVIFRRSLGGFAAVFGVAVGFGCSGGDNSGSNNSTAGGSTGNVTDSGRSSTASSSSPSTSSGSSSTASASGTSTSSSSDTTASSSSSAVDEGGAAAEASVNADGSVAADAAGDSSVMDGTVADGTVADGAAADASVGDGATDASSAGDAQDASSTADATADGPVAEGGADTGAQDAASDAGSEGGAFAANYTFDTTTEGWSIIETSDNTLATAAVAWNGALGDPNPGSLQVTVPFSRAGQTAMLGFAPTNPIDLTGRTITVHVYLASGLSSDAANPGAIQVFAQDAPPAWHWVSAGWTTLDSTKAGQWFTATLDLTATGNAQFDTTHVAHWGVQILTGGGAATPNYSTAVLDFDNVTVQ